MKNILIALFSPTYAEKTARLLREYGVRASRVTLPRSLVREGGVVYDVKGVLPRDVVDGRL